MFDWLNRFSEPGFMPHGHCYLWQPEILWAHLLSDATIAAAYYAIPVTLGIFLYKRRSAIPYPEILGLFVAFIFLCGTTHLFAIATIWYPAYEPQGWLKMLTAIVSLMTALVLIPKLPELIALPGVQQALDKAELSMGELKERNEQLESVYAASMDREGRIIQLKEEVNHLLSELNRDNKYKTE